MSPRTDPVSRQRPLPTNRSTTAPATAPTTPPSTPASSQRTSGVSQSPAQGASVTAPTTAPAAAPVVDNRDRVEPSRPQPTSSGADLTSLQRQVDELKAQLETERQARVAREKKEADEAKKPGFMRTVMEIFDLFGRLFVPFYNMASAAFRVLNIGYKLIAGQDVDWKKEGARLAADLAGAFVPGIGGVISAAVNGGMNYWFNESQVMGGANELFDGGVKKESGIRSMVDGTADLLKRAYNGAKGLVTGGDTSSAPKAGSVDTRPIKPAEVPVG